MPHFSNLQQSPESTHLTIKNNNLAYLLLLLWSDYFTENFEVKKTKMRNIHRQILYEVELGFVLGLGYGGLGKFWVRSNKKGDKNFR